MQCSIEPLCCFLSETPSFTSDSKCLHNLVSWAHHHGEACHSCPDLKEVLEDQCWGSVKVVWGCVDGHRYIMDTKCTAATNPGYALNLSTGALGSSNFDGVISEEEEQEEEGEEEEQPSAVAQHSPPAATAQTQSSALAHWTSNTEGELKFPKVSLVGHSNPRSLLLTWQLERGSHFFCQQSYCKSSGQEMLNQQISQTNEICCHLLPFAHVKDTLWSFWSLEIVYFYEHKNVHEQNTNSCCRFNSVPRSNNWWQ